MPHLLHPWPNENVERALAAVRSAFETGGQGKHAIWAQWSELEGQIALVHAHRDHPPHLYYLARLCTLLGLFNEANLCLDALEGAMNEIDLLVARSIVANCAEDDIVSALLLSQAFKKAISTRLEPVEIEDYATRIRMGEFTHKRVLNDMRFRHQIALDAAFETALIPYKLPQNSDYAIRLYYYQELEHAWSSCPRSGRAAFIAREEHLNGVSHALHLAKAHNSWLNRDFADANIHYDKARSLAIANGYGFVHFNCGTYSWLTDTPRPPEPHPISVAHWEWHWAPAPQTTPEVCLVLGCDSTYFNFFPKLLASLIQAAEITPPSATIRVVLGVARPQEEQIAFLQACSQALAEKKHAVQLSFAWGELSHPDGASYTCIRYMLLPEITRQYSCPIITLDIDAMIPRDFTNLLRTLKAEYDYGFRLYAFDRQGHQLAGEPWGFGATVSYFGETDQLPLLAQELHDYVVTAYNSANPTNWCVDQCGLSAVYHRYIAPRWDSLRIRFMDDDPAIVAMPHHYGMDKDSFRAWDGIVDIVPIYTSLGINPETARHLGQ